MFNFFKRFTRKGKLDEFCADFHFVNGAPLPFNSEGPKQLYVEYSGIRDHDLGALYLWTTPFRLPDKDNYWIIGGSIEDSSIMICAESGNKSVYSVRTYFSVDEMDFEKIEDSVDIFLSKLKY